MTGQRPFQYSDPSPTPDLIGNYLSERGIQATPENRNALWKAVVKVLDENAGLANTDSEGSEESWDPNQIPTIPGLLGDPTIGRSAKKPPSPYVAPQGPLPSNRNGQRSQGITMVRFP